MNFKDKLNLKANLKKQIEEEKQGKQDLRTLNYYDLKFDEKMTVLFVPDVNGQFWTRFKKHGPNLNIRGFEGINCAHKSSNEECPACQKAFGLLELAKETGNDAYKDEAKRWFAKDYVLTTVVVLESPMEIKADPTGNHVKLFYLPYAVENIITEAIQEGLITEDDLTTTPFIIKKTKNAGGQAEYKNSYFARKSVTDEELAYFDSVKIDLYNFEDLDVVPKPSSTEEVAEWLVKAEAKDEAIKNSKGNGSDNEPATKTNTKASQNDEKDDEVEDKKVVEESKEEPQQTSSASSLKDRLNALKNRQE